MIVKPIGPPGAKIMFVGEAPGREEEIQGIPFVGGSGKVLNQLLAQALIDRFECFMTNIMMDRPINNNFGQFYEDKARRIPSKFLLEGYERLKGEIQKICPNVIVAVGSEALKALTGLKGITKLRGSILSCTLTDTYYKVIPIIHPAAIMRMWEWAPLTLLDLERIKEEAKSPTHEFTPRLYHKIETITRLKVEVKRALKDEYLSFDIETCNNQISCIGFATSKSYAFVVPIHMFETSTWSATDEKIVWKLIKKLLESNLKKIGQNANFDMFFIETTTGIKVNNLWMDTMSAFHCVYPELPKGLDTLCSIYTDQPYYKDTIKTDYYRYNSLDCMITFECAMKIKEELIEFRTWGFYKNVVHPMLNILLHMELKGVRVDVKKKDLAASSMSEELKMLQKKLDKAIGHELNVNSSKQMIEFLYTELGLPVQYHKHYGAGETTPTANAKALNKLAKLYPSTVFDYILTIRDRRKILSTYLTAKVDEDNRIRCSYILSGTKSGRLASRMSRFGSGMNMQNVPKGLCREIIIPDEGYMFISADLSQAEMRVVAWLANDTMLIDIFESSKDVFNQVASTVFSVPVEHVTFEQRDLAKHLCHASNYGMGPGTFGEISGLSFADSKEKLNLYHINFPRIRMWQMEIEARLRKVRMLETPMGRRRVFFGRWNSALIRDAYSYIPQSTVSDVILMGMIELDRRLPKKCNILLNIHDEVVIQVPIKPKRCSLMHTDPVALGKTDTIIGDGVYGINWVMYIKALMVECMSIPIQINDRILRIPVNTKHGYDWNEVS